MIDCQQLHGVTAYEAALFFVLGMLAGVLFKMLLDR
jgi:hypothetical protein